MRHAKGRATEDTTWLDAALALAKEESDENIEELEFEELLDGEVETKGKGRSRNPIKYDFDISRSVNGKFIVVTVKYCYNDGLPNHEWKKMDLTFFHEEIVEMIPKQFRGTNYLPNIFGLAGREVDARKKGLNKALTKVYLNDGANSVMSFFENGADGKLYSVAKHLALVNLPNASISAEKALEQGGGRYR